jgi:hypothetical protein
MRWVGHVTCMGEMRNACTVLVGKPEVKGPLGRPRHGWEVNIIMNMNLREIGPEGVDWMHLAQDREQ